MPLLLDLADQTLADQNWILSGTNSATGCTRPLDEAETASLWAPTYLPTRKPVCIDETCDWRVTKMLAEIRTEFSAGTASYGAPGAQQKRFAAYVESLARAAGHADRTVPLESYCTGLHCPGLLLPGERKSVEPLAARLAPHDVRRVHQSLHHFVANAPWSDEALLERVRSDIGMTGVFN